MSQSHDGGYRVHPTNHLCNSRSRIPFPARLAALGHNMLQFDFIDLPIPIKP